jgi:exonuclease III
MKIIAWNICQGGGNRSPSILEALKKTNADICVLTEFREVESISLMKSLWEEGWSFQKTSFSKEKGVGLAIVSRNEFQWAQIPICPDEGRWLHVQLPNQEIDICAAYAPLASRSKEIYWDWMIDALKPLLDRRTLVVGDLNNGMYPEDHPEGAKPLPKWRKMQDFIDTGWTDLYRNLHPTRRESSWWTSHGAGFRIDHAFGSPLLREQVMSVSYVTSIRGATRPLVDVSGPSAGWTSRASSDHALIEVVVETPL